MGKRLTDLQMREILTNTSLSDESLAAQLDKSVSAVHNARWRLKSSMWVCSVRYEPCKHCGQTLTIHGRSPSHVYHPHCQIEARIEIQRRLDAKRTVPPEVVERIQQWGLETQQRTRKQATSNGARWSEDEDIRVVELLDRPIEETCIELGRTMFAVSKRRAKLLRNQADDLGR